MTSVPRRSLGANVREHGPLALVVSVSVLVALSATMINVALPVLVRDLQATASEANWLVLSYLLVHGCLLVAAGQFSDASDTRSVFLLGLALFVAMSAVLVVIQGPLLFIAARAVQGLAAALLLSNSATILSMIYSGPAFGRAMGYYLAGFAVAQAAGPSLGGVIASTLGWRWMFVLSVAVGVLGLLAGPVLLRALPTSGEQNHRAILRMDVAGNVVLAGAFSALIVGLSMAQREGWASLPVLGLLGTAGALVMTLRRVERDRARPAVDPSLLTLRGAGVFGALNVAAGLLNVPRVVPIVLLSLWFQGVEGAPAWRAGLLVTALPIGVGLGSVVLRQVGRGRSEAHLVAPTAIASALTSTALVPAVLWGGQWTVAFTLFAVGIATGLFSSASATTLLQVAPRDQMASANGLRTTFQLVGLAGGTAALLSITTSWLSPSAARAFLAGRPDLLELSALAAVRHGYAVGLVGLALLTWLAAWLSVVVRRRLLPMA